MTESPDVVEGDPIKLSKLIQQTKNENVIQVLNMLKKDHGDLTLYPDIYGDDYDEMVEHLGERVASVLYDLMSGNDSCVLKRYEAKKGHFLYNLHSDPRSLQHHSDKKKIPADETTHCVLKLHWNQKNKVGFFEVYGDDFSDEIAANHWYVAR
jgi:hypothetical protein